MEKSAKYGGMAPPFHLDGGNIAFLRGLADYPRKFPNRSLRLLRVEVVRKERLSFQSPRQGGPFFPGEKYPMESPLAAHGLAKKLCPGGVEDKNKERAEQV